VTREREREERCWLPGDAPVLRRPLPERVDGFAVVHRLLLRPRRASALPHAVHRRRRQHAALRVRRRHARRAHGQGRRVMVLLVVGLGQEPSGGGLGARGHPARHRRLVVVGHERRRPDVRVGLQEPAVVVSHAAAVSVVVEAGGVVQAQRHGLRLRRAQKVLKLRPCPSTTHASHNKYIYDDPILQETNKS
jgi:hypothetical protein